MEVQITPAQIDMDILDVDEQRITAEKLNNSPTTLTVNKTRSKLFLDQVLLTSEGYWNHSKHAGRCVVVEAK